MSPNYLIKILKNHWLEIFIGLIGLLMLTDTLTKEKIDEHTKLIELKSPLKSYNFYDGTRGHKHYYFYCNNYCNKFQIKADYLDYFNKENFPTQTGTEITFRISENDYIRINDCNKIFVYDISTKNQTLLSLKKVIEFERKRIDLIFSILFILGATIAFIVRYRATIKK